ncbi:MAG: biotin/lipoyl-binding protein [Lachnospiraceae bacterium]|nr:biotin/lipoyl-binding protein [Lachnospiraceae bacterium]
MRGKVYRLSVSIISLFSIVALSGCQIIPKEEEYNKAALVKEYEADEFSMATVKRGDVRDYKRINCEYLNSNVQNVELGDWEMIKKINVKVGDKVKEGDVLAEYMSDDLDSAIEEVRYQIGIKEAMMEQAGIMQNLEIKKQELVLNDETAIQAIIENYDAEISRLGTELSDLNRQLEDYNRELEFTQIKAEFDGTVTYVNEELTMANPWERGGNGAGRGMNKAKNNRVVSITDGAKPYFVADRKSSEFVEKLAEGDTIFVSNGDERYETIVHFPNKRQVYFLMDDEPEGIQSGTHADAEYVIQERLGVLYLPKSAVYKMGEEYIVYLEDENGLKSAKKITIGLEAENKVEIVDGLQYGDSVIVR